MSDIPKYSECIPSTDSSPLCQGDIIQGCKPTSDAWSKFGIIVTADCDLARDKHHGIISYVPILELSDYLRLFPFNRRIKEQISRTKGELIGVIRKHQKKNLPDFPEPLSEDAINSWINNDPAEFIAAELQLQPGPMRERLVSQIDTYKNLCAALNSERIEVQVSALQSANYRKSFWQDVASQLDNLPGDLFFLNSLDLEKFHKKGYVAYLRLIREIDGTKIAIRTPDLDKESVTMKRVSRLDSPFRYQLTRQMADVFASIGLPSEYESSRRSITESLGRTTDATETKKEA